MSRVWLTKSRLTKVDQVKDTSTIVTSSPWPEKRPGQSVKFWKMHENNLQNAMKCGQWIVNFWQTPIYQKSRLDRATWQTFARKRKSFKLAADWGQRWTLERGDQPIHKTLESRYYSPGLCLHAHLMLQFIKSSTYK